MACTSRYIAEIHVIETTYSGIITLDELRLALTEILELSQQHQASRFIADCTHMEGGGRVLDSYEFAKEIEQIPNVHLLKEAFILPILKETADSVRFFETTAMNRGLNIRAFPSREEAIEWLTE